MTISELHDKLYEILKIINGICNGNNIRYFLDGGTELGAIREKDFIPWDDDLDIGILIEDYPVFLKAMRESLPDHLHIIEPSDFSPLFYDFVIRIIDDRWVLNDENEKSLAYNNQQNHVGIDVFVYCGMPKSRLGQKLYFFVYKVLYGMCMHYRYSIDWDKYTRLQKYQIKLLCLFGRIYSGKTPHRILKKHHMLMSMFDAKHTGYRCSGNGSVEKIYENVLKDEWFDGITYGQIRDGAFPVISGYDEKLKCKYGDYMVPEHDPHKYVTHLESKQQAATGFMSFCAENDKAVIILFNKLRKIDYSGTNQWESQIDATVETLFKKWSIESFAVNPDAYTGLVLECKSTSHGDVVIKMYPPFLKRRFIKESFICEHLKDYPQAPLIDVDATNNAMLLGRIIPGDYICFEEDKDNIIKMFDSVLKGRIEADSLSFIPKEIKGVVSQTEDELIIALKYDYYPDFVRNLVESASRLYRMHFANEKKYLLHGDIYYKNALRSDRGIQVIDPVGYVDDFIFEYMPMLTYEIVMHTILEDYKNKYRTLLNLFSEYTDTYKLNIATYIFLVKQLVPSIYEANDNFERANTFLRVIKELFLNENGEIVLDKCLN